MQLDKTKGYIFRVVDVEQAKAVVEVLVSQGYSDHWRDSTYSIAIKLGGLLVLKGSKSIIYHTPNISQKEGYNWVDTEMFLKYNPLPEVKETIQVGDTIFDKEEFELAVSKLKGVKA